MASLHGKERINIDILQFSTVPFYVIFPNNQPKKALTAGIIVLFPNMWIKKDQHYTGKIMILAPTKSVRKHGK